MPALQKRPVNPLRREDIGELLYDLRYPPVMANRVVDLQPRLSNMVES